MIPTSINNSELVLTLKSLEEYDHSEFIFSENNAQLHQEAHIHICLKITALQKKMKKGGKMDPVQYLMYD